MCVCKIHILQEIYQKRTAFRLTDRFVAYQGSGNLGDSKAAHSSGSQKFWSVQLLSLSPDSGLGDTDRSYFDFHSIFSDFADL